MKPYIKYTWSLLFSILVAGIPIFAQTESADDSYATPKTAGANLSLEGGIAVMWGIPVSKARRHLSEPWPRLAGE
ncbi:hypothetical protein M2447_002188 [Ereboglobus sp. PH5-10]|nr:hypothetical protein [Ereboglobus sp. PH5-10]